jgi:hypothetical protein
MCRSARCAHKVDEFGACVSFVRNGDPLKIHVAPDGSFSAFHIADECIMEGKGIEDLNRVLVAKAACPTLRVAAGAVREGRSLVRSAAVAWNGFGASKRVSAGR